MLMPPLITPNARMLAVEIRRVREESGLKLRELAEAIDVNHPRIVGWEKGYPLPSEDQLSRLLQVCGIRGDQRRDIIQLRRNAPARNYIESGVPTHLALLAEYEREATSITAVNGLLIPGLLQTSEYARQVISSDLANRDNLTICQIEDAVSARIARQSVIDGTRRISVFLSTSALRDMPCDRPASLGQLQQLLHLLESIDIFVVPSGLGALTALHESPFAYMEFSKSGPVIASEVSSTTVIITDDKPAGRAVRAIESVAAIAITKEETRQVIVDLIKEREQ